MFNKIKQYLKSDLIKVFSFTSLSTFIKILSSYVSVKLISNLIGPSGIALIGQLQNFTSIFTAFGAGGINNGIVKFTSEHKENESLLKKYLQNAFKITLVCSVFFGMLCLVLSKYISEWILMDAKFQMIFVLFGIGLILLSLNNFLISVINGFKEFKTYVIVNIITSIIGLFFTIFLVVYFNVYGALIAQVSFQSIIVFVTFYMVRKKLWMSKDFLWGNWDKTVVKKYLEFSLMAVITALTAPISQLLIRKHLIQTHGIDQAGVWEGMNRVSGLFLMFVTTSFGVYYLPKLSEISKEYLLKLEILKTYKVMAPFVLISLVVLYFSKNLVIEFVFSDKFLSMRDLFFWQLLGDFFKIMSWILAFLMVAKSMTKVFIISEIVFSITLVVLSYYFINKNGLIGATQSYCINYILYFICMLFVFKKILYSKKL